MSKHNNPLISIIIPVYNAGTYLKPCLDTLLNQTLKEIEIILVIDCPTDASDVVAKEYAEKDDRIILIENTQNQHIGQSRNIGIQAAKGEYIGFSDHDDFRELFMYEKLYSQAKKTNAEIILSDYVCRGDRNNRVKLPDNLVNSDLKKTLFDDTLRGGNDDTNTPYALTVQTNIYKTELIKKNKVLFVDTNNCTPEDRIFQIMCLFYAKSVSQISEALYYHRTYSSSTGKGYKYISIKTRANGKAVIFEFLNQNNIYDTYEKLFLTSVKREFTELLLREFEHHKNVFRFFQDLQFLKSFPYTKNAFKKTHYSLQSNYSISAKILRRTVAAIVRIFT